MVVLMWFVVCEAVLVVVVGDDEEGEREEGENVAMLPFF